MLRNKIIFKKNIHLFSQFSKKFLSSQTDTVVYNHQNKFFTEIVLNNPKALNSLDLNMIKSLLKTCRRWLPENDVQELQEAVTKEDSKPQGKSEENIPKVVLMSGAGPKAFCAGGDVVSIYNLKKQGKPVEEVCEFFK